MPINAEHDAAGSGGAGSDEIEFLEKIRNVPPPLNCIYSRFILPVSLYQALREHPLSRELYPTSAGVCQKDRRRQENEPLLYGLIYYCTGGIMTLHVEGNSHPVGPGDLIVIPPGMAHVTEGNQSSPWNFFYVAYAGERAEAYTQFLNVSSIVTRVGLNPEWVAEFERLCDLRTSGFLIDTFVRGANRLKSLLTHLSLAIPQVERINMDAIRRLMANRMDGSLTLKELAQSVNMSRFHFERVFKKLAGISPMRYYIQERIQHACHLLDTTRDPISQIAAAVGYEDPHYFSRIFRQVVGQTPRAYRAGMIKGSVQ